MFSQLLDDIASIQKRDPAARSKFEIATCYPGVHAIVFHRFAHALWVRKLYWAARFISQFARWMTGIEIHPGASIGRRVFIDHGMGVVIGETAEVGDDCTIYQAVTLGGTTLYRGIKRHPTLEAGVIVGAGAQVLGGFSVGAGAKIGSNAVVVKPVPAGATAVGNPARIIEAREPESVQTPETTIAKEVFTAYGITQGENDPLSKALHALVAHSAAQDKRIDAMVARLKAAGLCCDADDPGCLDTFDPEALNKMVD